MKYEHLFKPIQIGGTVFRNRIFGAPIGHPHLSPEQYITADGIAWFERKAKGGSASVNVGSVLVDNAHGAVGPLMRADDPTALPSLYRLANAIQSQGSVAVAEILHCGANSYHSKFALGNEIYGAFDCKNGIGMDVKAMPEEMIEKVIEAHADAAAFLKYAGFGMVTLHAGHGWLLNQFACPENTRNDQWGGSIENQCRIIVKTIDRIHQKCGRRFPVDVRLSGAALVDGGYDLDYAIEVAKQLEGHADMLNISVGVHEDPEVIIRTIPSMFMEDGANLKYAAEIKKHVSMPVATLGGFTDPEHMEEVIASGQADIIYTSRAVIADPDMPLKAMNGKEDEIKKCIRCFSCYSAHVGKLEYCCALNPENGTEHTIPDAAPAVKKKVLVVGGGVGGMQAAISAAERGHDVVLCEKSDRLGGTLRCEEKVSFKQNLQKYLDTQAHILSKSPVEVRMNTEVTPEMAKQMKPDVIIAALGSTAVKPNIPGIDKPHVMCADEAFLHEEKVGHEVTVLGGGLVGIELAIHLSQNGHKVRILEMANSLNDGGNTIHALALNREIRELGIEVHTSTKANEITDTSVIGEYVGDAFSVPSCETINKAILQSCCFGLQHKSPLEEGTLQEFTSDTVVYAIGQKPMQTKALEFYDCAPEFYAIGDCVIPKNITQATKMAHSIARNIGRI